MAEPAPKLPRDMNPDELRAEALRRYGSEISVYIDNPEIWNIVMQAAREERDELWLEGQIHGTNWWKQHTLNQRRWDQLEASDPATAALQVSTRKTDIQKQAETMGLTIDPARLDYMVRASLRDGWTDDQVRSAVAGEYEYRPEAPPSGISGVNAAALKEIASDYLVPLSNEVIDFWVTKILDGTQTQQSFQAYIADQAKSRFPALSQAIDSGISVRKYMDPYFQMAGDLLEINPSTIDPSQGKWISPLMSVDPKTGQRVPMSLTDWERTIKTDVSYGYDKTNRARNEAADLNARVGRMFGFV